MQDVDNKGNCVCRQPTPVFLPGESQGLGSLVGCCLWGLTESDTTERLSSSSSSVCRGELGLLYKVEQISPKLEQKGVKKQWKDLFRESKGLLKRRVKIEDNIQEKIQEVKGKRLQITRNWVPSTNDEKEPTPKNHCNFRTLYSRKG